MNLPSGKNSANPIADEQQRNAEFYVHEEWQRSKENPSTAEFFRSEEVQERSGTLKSAPKKQDGLHHLTLLSSTGMGVSVVAATVAVSVAVILPANTSQTEVPPVLSSSISTYEESIEEAQSSETPSSSSAPEIPEIPAFVFTMSGQEIGLDFFQGKLTVENAAGVALHALLKDESGRTVAQTPLGADGSLSFTELRYESKYTISVVDEEGSEQFAYPFTTQPFVTLLPLSDGTGAKLITHSSISMMNDCRFELYDAEGKVFDGNLYMQEIYGEPTNPNDSATIIGYEHCLSYEDLYVGEYRLRLITYTEEEEIIYEKKLYLGDLTPLVYTASVSQTAGEITLQYESGDLGAYSEFSVELYQNGEWYGYGEATQQADGSITVPISADWASGTYTLYLVGNFYNQIWMCEITI